MWPETPEEDHLSGTIRWKMVPAPKNPMSQIISLITCISLSLLSIWSMLTFLLLAFSSRTQGVTVNSFMCRLLCLLCWWSQSWAQWRWNDTWLKHIKTMLSKIVSSGLFRWERSRPPMTFSQCWHGAMKLPCWNLATFTCENRNKVFDRLSSLKFSLIRLIRCLWAHLSFQRTNQGCLLLSTAWLLLVMFLVAAAQELVTGKSFPRQHTSAKLQWIHRSRR